MDGDWIDQQLLTPSDYSIMIGNLPEGKNKIRNYQDWNNLDRSTRNKLQKDGKIKDLKEAIIRT